MSRRMQTAPSSSRPGDIGHRTRHHLRCPAIRSVRRSHARQRVGRGRGGRSRPSQTLETGARQPVAGGSQTLPSPGRGHRRRDELDPGRTDFPGPAAGRGPRRGQSIPGPTGEARCWAARRCARQRGLQDGRPGRLRLGRDRPVRASSGPRADGSIRLVEPRQNKSVGAPGKPVADPSLPRRTSVSGREP